MKRIKPFLPAISIFCIALLVRIVYNLTVAPLYYPLHDSLGDQIIAFNILDKHCFCLSPNNTTVSTVTRVPLWPLVISGVSLIADRANIFDRLFLSCADAGTCVLTYLFARDLFNKRLGLVAGLIACVYPALYIYTGWMYTETLFTFLLTAICYCVFRIQRNEGKSRRLWILCGVLLALLTLTRPNGIVVAGLVILWAAFLIWRKRLSKRVLIPVALATLIACALIAPWTIRNYLVSNRFVSLATGDGQVLVGAYNNTILTDKNYIGSWVRSGLTGLRITIPPCQGYTACEVAHDNAETDAAIQWVKSHLNDIPLLMVYHLRNFFTPYTGEADMPMNRFPNELSSQIVLAMSETFPIPIFLLAALGLVVTFKIYWHELFFAYCVVLSTLGEILIFYGNARFRSPIEPILILLTTGALWWLTHTEPGTLRWKLSQPGQQVTTAHQSD
jgi:4-amino-4-deoxy-L-arabinose transferase-like glycosyltransferase